MLSIDQVKTIPEQVKAGDIAELMVSLTNNKNSALRDIAITIDLEDLPFNVVSSTNEKVFPLIANKETIDAGFKILVEGDTDSGIYNVPVSIAYTDDAGKSYTKSVIAGVIVDNTPDFVINLDESSLYSKDKQYSLQPTDDVLLSVTNIGSSQIKAFSMELLDSDYFVVISSPLMTPTNLDPDDYETQEYTIHVNKPVMKSVKVPMQVKIRYKDSFNNQYESTETVMLTLLSKADAITFGLAKPPSFVGLIVLVVIIGIVVFLVVRKWFWKKKK